jgi:hypothetical protein
MLKEHGVSDGYDIPFAMSKVRTADICVSGVTVPKKMLFPEVIESKLRGCTERPAVGKSNWKT